jgi:hypothetical protein
MNLFLAYFFTQILLLVFPSVCRVFVMCMLSGGGVLWRMIARMCA